MKYTLYLDESATVNSTSNKYFSVGGVIIESSYEQVVSTELDALKRKLWPRDSTPESYILHEKEVSAARNSGRSINPENRIFRAKQKYKDLYAGLSKIIKQYPIVTIGTCIDISKLNRLYSMELNSNFKIAIQLLLENYCHFLMKYNAQGDICYESLQEPGNQELRQRFYELEALGTMYYTSHFFQTHIGDIRFRSKTDNLAGLQLADFIPNTFGRDVAGLSPKHKDFKKAVFYKAYDGGMGMKDKYGLKIIP